MKCALTDTKRKEEKRTKEERVMLHLHTQPFIRQILASCLHKMSHTIWLYKLSCWNKVFVHFKGPFLWLNISLRGVSATFATFLHCWSLPSNACWPFWPTNPTTLASRHLTHQALTVVIENWHKSIFCSPLQSARSCHLMFTKSAPPTFSATPSLPESDTSVTTNHQLPRQWWWQCC